MHDSSFGRPISVLFAPDKTFRSIAERPTWSVAVAVVIVAQLAFSALLIPRIDWRAEAERQIAEFGVEIPEEQLEQQIELQERFGSITVYAAAVLGPLVLTLFLALVFWGLFSLLGGRLSYRTSLSVTVHGWMAQTVNVLLSIPVLLGQSVVDTQELRSRGLLASNLAAFAPEETSSMVEAVLGSADLFSVWTVILLALGFRAAAGLSTAAAAGGVGALWLVWVLLRVGFAAVMSAVAG